MRWIAVGAIAATALFFAPSGMASTKPPPHKGAPQKISTPSASSQEVEWDPISCWDCPTPYEPEAMFFTGLVFALPISLWVIRCRTRKLESVSTKRWLE
jgi:hypothetical protein